MKYWTLYYTQYENSTTEEEEYYNLLKKWIDMERNFAFALYWIKPENEWRNRDMVTWDKNSLNFTRMGRIYDKITLHESLT